uniref:PAQR family membrane homeostasis protein TrhA n=1 Tax=Roseomonas acroporae TaxID=2937791 RepID=UPI0031F5878E
MSVSTAIIAGVVLVWSSARASSYGPSAAVIRYVAGLLGMLGASAAYNMVAEGSARRGTLRRLDRAAIFTMVAGTCTVMLHGTVSTPLACAAAVVIWSVALLGTMGAMFRPGRHENAGLIACLVMGWGTAALLLWGPVATGGGLGAGGTWWLLAGGALYSVGIGFHLWHALPFQNAIWHGFVSVAAACHYVAVLGLVT